MNRAVGLLVEGTKGEGKREEVSLSDALVDQLRQSGWTSSVMGSVRKWFAYTADQFFLSGVRESWHEFDCVLMQ